MTLSTGTRLGPYEIVAPIGAGGMGEVYKARDTRLDRSVAIKILPAEFAQNAQLKARFEREAKTISQLNHPNICTLYDVGENYLVMELLDGESLADRVIRGPLSVPEVLKFGVQIAEALGKAHREGVVHRDLKPANIMLTKSGAKLLDFGLAKTTIVAGNPEGATAQKPLTQEGVVLGTFQYMAPEQLAGEEPDARTDIFALGAVLYEMATGKRAFQGKTKTSLIAAIIDRDPIPISQLQPLTPPAVEHIILKCLSKEPDDRWQSAHDIAEELRWISEAGSQRSVAVAGVAGRKARERAMWSSAIVGLAIVCLVLYLRPWEQNKQPPSLRFTITPPGGASLSNPLVPHLAISPDGRTIAFVVGTGNTTDLYVRPLDAFESRRVAGTTGATGPFFSPDGKSIGFSARGILRRVFLDGDTVSDVCPAANPTGAHWADDGTILFAPDYNSGIARIAASGGRPQMLTTLDRRKNESSHAWPQFLPGRKWMIFTIENSGKTFDDAIIVAQSLVTGERRVLINGGTFGRYVPTGHLLYARSSALYAVPFDAKRIRVIGTPVQVMSNVKVGTGRGALQLAVSNTGVVVYTPGAEGPLETSLLVFDRQGKQLFRTRPLPIATTINLSPDGKKVVFERGAADDEIWIYDFEREASIRVAFRGENVFPIWSHDGSHLIFSSDRDGQMNIYTVASDGTGDVKRLTTSRNEQIAASTGPDGTIAYTEQNSETGRDLWLLPANETNRPRPLLVEPGDQSLPIFSPDGKWIAYVSNDSGPLETYVRSIQSRERWLISTEGGSNPLWSRDGRELFYRAGLEMMVVPMFRGSTFAPGKPRSLFRMAAGFRGYVVTADNRFIFIEAPKSYAFYSLNVISNWFDELRSRVATVN